MVPIYVHVHVLILGTRDYVGLRGKGGSGCRWKLRLLIRSPRDGEVVAGYLRVQVITGSLRGKGQSQHPMGCEHPTCLRQL